MNRQITNHSVVPLERINQAIFLIRGRKIMLDRNLAQLYGVKAIALRQQVKRNRDRFPNDFMFQLSKKEVDLLVSQNVIPSKRNLGGFFPYAFTQEGVAMLSSVLHSKRAVLVIIAIMRAFVKFRRLLATNIELARKLSGLENKYDAQFKVVFEAIRKLMIPSEPKRRPIGFRIS